MNKFLPLLALFVLFSFSGFAAPDILVQTKDFEQTDRGRYMQEFVNNPEQVDWGERRGYDQVPPTMISVSLANFTQPQGGEVELELRRQNELVKLYSKEKDITSQHIKNSVSKTAAKSFLVNLNETGRYEVDISYESNVSNSKYSFDINSFGVNARTVKSLDASINNSVVEKGESFRILVDVVAEKESGEEVHRDSAKGKLQMYINGSKVREPAEVITGSKGTYSDLVSQDWATEGDWRIVYQADGKQDEITFQVGENVEEHEEADNGLIATILGIFGL